MSNPVRFEMSVENWKSAWVVADGDRQKLIGRVIELENWVENFRRYLSNRDIARELQADAARILKNER